MREVEEEYERNFAERGDKTAAFAAWRGDELLVDLGGDTLFPIFSGTKGVLAVCLLLLHERGLIDHDAAVKTYWPEFGKPEIRVRDVLGHTSQLPGVERELTLDELTDSALVTAALERQSPSEDPRAALTYHSFTYGWLCAELIRRADGRTASRFIAEEIAGPLELELWLGLPEEQESRVATLELAPSWEGHDPEELAADPLLRSVWGNPVTFAPESFPWNSRAYHAAGIPGAGGIATARSMAKLYGQLDRLLSRESLALANTTFSQGIDHIAGSSKHFGPGFQLQTERMSMGPVPDAFGHSGAGGSVHGRWPGLGVGFSYCMSVMRDDEEVDPRPAALLAALHRAVTRAA